GSVLHMLGVGADVGLANFAVAGMAGMVAGATGAVLTAIVMLFEMTWNYGAILPVVLSAVTAYAVRQRISPASIYTLKLVRRGHMVPQGLQSWMAGAQRARDIMSTDFVIRTVDQPGQSGPVSTSPRTVRVVVRDGHITGVGDGAGLGTVVHATVAPDDRLGAVLRAIERTGARVALVMATRDSTSPRDLLGVISDREIAAEARATAHLME